MRENILIAKEVYELQTNKLKHFLLNELKL